MYGKRRAHVLSLTYAKTLRRWDLVCYMSNFLYLDHYSLTFSYPTVPQCSCTLSLMYCQEPRRFFWLYILQFTQKQKEKMKETKGKWYKHSQCFLKLDEPPPSLPCATEKDLWGHFIVLPSNCKTCEDVTIFKQLIPQNRKYKVGNLFSFQIYCVLNIKLNK